VTPVETAFVGDIHGNSAALNGLFGLLDQVGNIDQIVFLGDYINKGRDSAAVIQTLLDKSKEFCVTTLCGNHETEMLTALETGDLASFLKMGGASTIRSYVKREVSPDVISDFRACVPIEHIEFLRRMPQLYETEYVIASHQQPVTNDTRFRISAHIPVGDLPAVSATFAYVDTGCGTSTGRLTALVWPSLTYFQVDCQGNPIESEI
jgi:hypothetical protein